MKLTEEKAIEVLNKALREVIVVDNEETEYIATEVLEYLNDNGLWISKIG